MSNVSALFENLMTYNDTHKSEKKTVVENDTTLLNLTVEIPTEKEDITPEDVSVNVGVMNVEDEKDSTNESDVETEENDNDDISVNETSDEIEDVTPEDENDNDTIDDNSDDSKEESLNLRKETIRQKRLEAKRLKEAKKIDESTECINKDENDCETKLDDVSEESIDVETAKLNIRKRVAATEECVQKTTKTESLMHLDTKSLNKLFTEFVKENYKNIDKVVITKAMLENRMLKLEGTITNTNGESTSISLTNRGFNPAKLENKRFIMDFKDTSNTFEVVKESLKQPFVFMCTLKEGILTFEELTYSFKTMFESKVAEISGKCTLTESVEPKNENADQVKKFNEIVDKIKSAKTANDLITCKDEMDDSNIGDTLLAAAQLVWDDVNSRMKAQ